MKKITLLFFMLLFGFLGHSQVENFDDPTVTVPTTPGPWVLPSGTWQIYDNGIGSTNWTLSNGAFPANSGTQAAYINRQNIGAGNTSRDYLVTPLLVTPANPQLLFSSRTTIAGNNNTVYEVRAALGTSDPLDPASFTIVLGTWADDVLNTNFDQYEEKTINIPATVGPSFYIAFIKITTQPANSQVGDRWLLDDIKIIEKCQDADVETLTATTLSNSATLTWDGTGNNQWEVHVLPQGQAFNPTAGTPIIVNGTPSTVVTATTQPTAAPLTPLTTYVYYVRSICDFSNGDWIGPSDSFTTQALPPECGGNYVDSGGANGEYSNNEFSTITICPDNPGDIVTVTFTSFSTEAFWDGLYVYDGNSTSAPLFASSNGAGNTDNLSTPGAYWGNTNPGTFEATNADGCLTFQFSSDGSGIRDGWSANVTCAPPPACPKPTAITVTGVLSTSAVVSWTNVGPATSWEVIAVPCGSPVPSETTAGTPASGSPFTLANLAPDTCYDFYVRSNCASTNDGFSPWAGPKSATTQLVPPACGGTFTDTGGSNDQYANGENIITTICPETPGDIVTVTFTSFDTESGWDGFYVHDGNSVSAPIIPSDNGGGFNANLNLPGAYWGTTNPGSFEATSPDGCLTFQFFSDGSGIRDGWVANVTCAPPPACPKPTAVSVDTFTDTSAVVHWTNVGPGTAWEVIAVPCGSPAPSSATSGTPATSNPFTLEGLNSDTCYDFYVRANCESTNNGFSAWSGPKSGTTQIAPPECGGVFTDSGGANDSYSNGENLTWTICPETPGQSVTVIFTSFATESNFDALYVFNGNSTSAPQIPSTNGAGSVPGGLPGGFWGNTIPGPFQSTSADGCLTFNFRSDGSATPDGWSANVICSPCPFPENVSAVASIFSATLNWNATPGTTYQVYIVPAGSPAPTETTTPTYTGVTTVPFTTGNILNPETEYDFYVRANCSNGTDVSAWSQPGHFTTLPTCPAPINITSESTTTDATISWTEVGPATSWEVWVLPAGSPAPTPGTGTVVTQNPATNPITYNTLTGPGGQTLFPGLYDFYVLSICSDSDSSAMAGPESFFIQNVDPVCASVQPSNPDINSDGVINLCPGNSCVDLSATFTENNQTTSYAVDPIPFSPPFPFEGGTELPINIDDIWGEVFTLPFNFCFFGTNYNTVQVGSNGAVSFGSNFPPFIGGGCPWNTTPGQTVPNTAFPIKNAIFGVYQDIDPSVDTPVTHTINYQVLGTAPCRTFVVNFVNMAQFSCELDVPLQTSQIVLYETSNQIDVYVQDRVPCTNWNEALGVIGIINNTGTQGYTPPNRNLGGWEAHNEAWRFRPTGASNVTFSWLMNGQFYSNNTNINVCVDETTVLTAQAVYQGCGGVITTKTTDVTLQVNPIDVLPVDDVQQCDPYVLPTLAVGNYYTEPNGQGTMLNAGDTISSSQTIYVYANITTGSNSCSDEESFTVTIGGQAITTPGDQTVCNEYILPALATGNYFTGQNGTGNPLNAGDAITTTQEIYVYLADALCPAQDSFTVTVLHQPDYSNVSNTVNECNSYTVPTPADGHYYSEPAGAGTVLDGTTITSNTTIYLFGGTGICTSEVAIAVNIGTITADDLADVSSCGCYTLLPLSANNSYHTAPNGGGTVLNAGDCINTSQTIYVWASSGESCNDESEFDVTIFTNPVVPTPSNVEACDSYALPALTSGAYYSQPGGNAPITGSDLTLGVGNHTVYVFLAAGTGSPCTDAESSFTVNVTASPTADVIQDVTLCDGQSFALPALSPDNTYWTESGGTGTQHFAGESITQTTQFYVYAVSPDNSQCKDETSFTVTVTAAPEFTIAGGCQGNAYVLEATAVNYDPATASYSWSASAGDGQVVSGGSTASATVSGAGTYTLTVTVAGCDGQAPYVASSTSCTIQKGISANGDGANDFFDLEGFNVRRLEIYNRYGMKVYERANYTNEWKGQSDKGDELPDGTYYYVIERNDGEPTKTGWIYINRKN